MKKLLLYPLLEEVNASYKSNRYKRKKNFNFRGWKFYFIFSIWSFYLFLWNCKKSNNNKSVVGITYDSHDALVIKSFEEIYNEADQKLNIKDKAVFIEHAKGYLNLGEISIIIAVACKHRDEVYELSRYIIEEIKKRSPIWKKEHYTDNESDWLKGNPIVHEKK